MPHAAEDAADFDAEVPVAARETAIDGLDDVGGRDFVRQVDEQLRGVTRFRVDDALAGFVLDKLVGDALNAWS